MAPKPETERGCSRVCVILLYLLGMILIIAGIVAGVFILNYPDFLMFLAIGSGSAILLGIVFVSLSACVCTRRRQQSSKQPMEMFKSPTLNGSSVKDGSLNDLKEVSVRSRDGPNGITSPSRAGDGFLNSAVAKGEFFHNSSVDVPGTKKQQKPVTSSPRTVKAKVGEQDFQESPKIPEIPKAPRAADSLKKSKQKSAKKFPNAPSSVSDFASLGLHANDAVFGSSTVMKEAPKPAVKGRGRVPLTAFKQTSKSVSDLDDETSFDSAVKPAQHQQSSAPKCGTPQLDHRLAASCHNILSEEPVRVGIAYLRQREATAGKPPVPRKVTGIALPGMTQRPPAAPGSTSQSQDDLSRVRRKAAEPSAAKLSGPLRDQRPPDIQRQLQHKSVPDLFLDNSKANLLDISNSSYSKSTRTTGYPSELDTTTSSYEPVRPVDLEKYNTVGLPTPPPSLQPKPFRSTDAQPFRMYAPKQSNPGPDKQPLMSEWTVSISSKSDTLSSDDADCQRQLSSSQELLMGSNKCLETEI